ncbi:MAG: peptidoglycan DD-metalloendopeptidase family protein [Candidatus Colwellbacteria bacterium]|nr:peptidoglycan DD-metalloendopeptidase family protein [Candidatus Colwellbacteria bacterium]
MRSYTKIFLLALLVTCSGFLVGAQDLYADSEEDLQRAIEEKRLEMEDLTKQIDQTQSKITTLQGQGRTLGEAIGQLDSGIRQADLNIQATETNIEKLSLEIESLTGEAQEVGSKLTFRQSAVSELLRQLQRKDEWTLLESLLTSQTISEGVAEINAITDLQGNLANEVAELTQLHEHLNTTIVVSDDKRDELAVETINLENRKVILDEQKSQKQDLLVVTKSQEGEYQKLLSTLEEEQQALLSEISDIETQLGKDFDRSTVPSRQKGFLAWPVTSSGGVAAGVITQNYGETAYSTRYYRGRPHNGLDIGAPTGTEVRAAADGVIIRSDYNGLYYQYGRYVLIDHQNGLSTLYAHLSKSSVSSGQKIEKGDLIGYVGSTGFSTGPHLHFGLYATPVSGWTVGGSREVGGLVSVPPASGLVPIGVTLNPTQYL